MGRVALVTGGTRGIGEGISRQLQEDGYRVVANYAGNEEAAAKFRAKYNIPAYKFDVGDDVSVQDAISRIEQEVGSIDVLVVNAGITRDKALHRMSVEMWDEVMRINLRSLFLLSRAVVPQMRERHFGRVIAISSVNAQKGQFGQTNYAAAKAGMIGFIKSLAQEGASKGITANAVAPGYVATEMVAAIDPEILNTQILPQIPVGRLGVTQDVARAVSFLASDAASFVTGSTLSVNGGQYMS